MKLLGQELIPAHLEQDKRRLALHWHGLGIYMARSRGGKERLRVRASSLAAAVLDDLFIIIWGNGLNVPGEV